jgi:hypothetical protein
LLDQVLNGLACLYRRLGDVGGLRVSNIRAERGCQRRTAIEQRSALRLVGANPGNAAVLKHSHRRCQDARRVDCIPRDHRHHDVQLELPCVGRGENRRIASVDLEAHLVDHLRH